MTDTRVARAKDYLAAGPLADLSTIEVQDMAEGLLAYAEERERINIGLIAENTDLKAKVRQQKSETAVDLSAVPADALLDELRERL